MDREKMKAKVAIANPVVGEIKNSKTKKIKQ